MGSKLLAVYSGFEYYNNSTSLLITLHTHTQPMIY